jgi:hypothetical protein
LIAVKATDNTGATTVCGNIPIEVLSGDLTTPVFYRAIDVGSSTSSTIDGHAWEAGNTAANVIPPVSCGHQDAAGQPGCGGAADNYYGVPADPPISDPAKLHMIQTGFIPIALGPAEAPTFNPLVINNVPPGTYQLYVYNSAAYGNQSFFSVLVNGELVKTNEMLNRAGMWSRLGPFTAVVNTSGTIEVNELYPLREGAPPRIAGIEIYRLEPGIGAIKQPPHVSVSVGNIVRSNPLCVTADLTARVTAQNMNDVSYFWRIWRAPAQAYFSDKTGLSTKVYLSKTGTYQLQLVASDGRYTSESNVVTVDVPPIPSVFSSSANAALSGARFYRGYNLNGPNLTIEGHAWQGKKSREVVFSNFTNPWGENKPTFDDQEMSLFPSDVNIASGALAAMLRDGVSRTTITIKNIPSGIYQVYEYIIEEGQRPVTTADMYLNGQIVQQDSDHIFGILGYGLGYWRKMGPYTIPITNGRLVVDSFGSYAGAQYSLAGIELWKCPLEFNLRVVPP